MAISIITAAPNPALVGNITRVKLQSDKFLLAAGNAADCLLEFGNTSNGQKFGLAYLENLLFEFKTVPDDSGFQMPLFNNTSEFNAFVVAFKGNYYINRDFTVTTISAVLPYQIQLVAKENGQAYSITVNTPTALTGYLTNPGVDDLYAENFKPLTEIFVRQGASFILAGTTDAATDPSGNFEVYIQEVLRDFIQLRLAATSYPGAALDKLYYNEELALLSYYLLSYERYGNPAVNHAPLSIGDAANPKYAANVGLDWVNFPGNTFNQQHFVASVARQFFTNNKSRVVSPLQFDYLMIYTEKYVAGSFSFTISLNLYYTNGQSSLGLGLGLKTIGGGQDQALWTIGIDIPSILNLATIAGRTVDYFTIETHSTWDSATSELITFYLDRDLKEYNNFFKYKNRLGAWEVFWCSGEIRQIAKFEQIEAQLSQRAEYEKSDFDVFTYNNSYSKSFKINTGYKTLQELNKLTELFDSNQIYILDGNFGTEAAVWRSVIIDKSSDLELPNQLGENYEHSFEFKNAFSEFQC